MQSSSTFDHNTDLSTFSFGLDTPSKFLTGNSPFSLNSGLTPSLFGSLNAPKGFTPSLGDAYSANEFNPFEATLSSGEKTRRSSFSALLDGHGDLAPPSTTFTNDFDLLSTNQMSNGRKRALSSPAVHTPGGSTFPFLANPQQQQQQAQQMSSRAMPNLAIKPSKRPRMSVRPTESSSSDARINSGGHSDTSPESSSLATPPDSSFSHLVRSNDIDVNDQNLSQRQQLSQNVFSQLAQQQHLLFASNGPSAMHQPQPLPMRPLGADIPIKPEEVEPTPSAPMPILTRSASKKGKAPVRASPAPSSATGSPAPQPKPKRAGGKKKNTASAAVKKGSEKNPEDFGDDGDLSEDSLKRKQFLERNRIAACKSRQKKKEKVGKLELDAADLCRRNQLLQASALALRQEILTLRQIIQTHDGCSCEHAQGYIKRDREGRGIDLLDSLAGRTMHLDYAVPPKMGTEDDVYSYLEDYARNGTVDEAFTHGIEPPRSTAMSLVPTNVPMPNLAAAPSFTPSTMTISSPSNHQRRQSDTTLFENSSRNNASNGTLAQQANYNADSLDSLHQFGIASFDQSNSAIDPTAQALLAGGHPGLPRRQSSAPPTTPSWGESSKTNVGGDYFSYTSTNV